MVPLPWGIGWFWYLFSFLFFVCIYHGVPLHEGMDGVMTGQRRGLIHLSREKFFVQFEVGGRRRMGFFFFV